MALTLENFSDADEAVLRTLLDQVESHFAATGSLELNYDLVVKETGFTVSVSFGRKKVPISDSHAMAVIHSQAPATVAHLARKLLNVPDAPQQNGEGGD